MSELKFLPAVVDKKGSKQIPPIVVVDGLPNSLQNCDYETLCAWVEHHGQECPDCWHLSELITEDNYKVVAMAISAGTRWGAQAFGEQTFERFVETWSRRKGPSRRAEIKNEKQFPLLAECIETALDNCPEFKNPTQLKTALLEQHIEVLKLHGLPTSESGVRNLLNRYINAKKLSFPLR